MVEGPVQAGTLGLRMDRRTIQRACEWDDEMSC